MSRVALTVLQTMIRAITVPPRPRRVAALHRAVIPVVAILAEEPHLAVVLEGAVATVELLLVVVPVVTVVRVVMVVPVAMVVLVVMAELAAVMVVAAVGLVDQRVVGLVNQAAVLMSLAPLPVRACLMN